MNIHFNSTDEFIEELDHVNDPNIQSAFVKDGIVRIGLMEALDENTTDIYMSTTFVSGEDLYELIVHCGRNDQWVSDGSEEYRTMRESMEDLLADKDLEIRSGRIDG